MSKIFCFIFFYVLPVFIIAQKLTGKVIEANTQKPIVAASIYLSNTSIGCISNNNGEFVMEKIPIGKYDLIVSCLGYEPFVQTIESGNLPVFITVKLKTKIKELAEVVVETYDKDGWKKWGNFFLENFIGKSSNATNCKILNKDVIKFKYSHKQNVLNAFALEPLIIQNKSLGYNIKFELQVFSYDYNKRLLFYAGYPFFQEMDTKRTRQQKRWNERRDETYYGSMMHFMRALFRNKLKENEFEVRKMIDKNNASYLINTILPGDSVAYAIDNTTIALEFLDKLDIMYKGRKAPYEYANQPFGKKDEHEISQIKLTGASRVEVVSNGSYYDPMHLLSFGYWAWSEKMANMLPYDFKPQTPANKKSQPL
jgi:hypothetical protein